MTTRSEFLERVAAGLGRRPGAAAAPLEPPPAVDEGLVRLTLPGTNLTGMFSARAAAAGIVVHRSTLGGAASTVVGLVASLGATRLVLDHLDPPVAAPLAAALSVASATILDPRAGGSLDAQFDAEVGITGVIAAIAETGTLVLASDATRSRGAFIIPPVHVAIVREEQIIPDMVDLWPRIGNRPPTAITLISGPSKTADIEGILVTGVHGPGAVHVILVERTQGETP